MNHQIKGQINLLSFIAVDYGDADPTLEEVLRFLCPPAISSDVKSLVQRYQAIGPPSLKLTVVPVEQEVLSKILLPLRQAKASYVIGNYLAVITLCGMVAEIVAIFLWELEDAKLKKLKTLTKKDQEKLFGKEAPFPTEQGLKQWFERCGQKDRVQLLSKFRLIETETKSSLDAIRETRRKYLHFLSKNHDSLPDDAIKLFHKAQSLVAIAVGAKGFQDGKVILSNKLIEYLKRQDVVST